jgi:hypothetical protein
MKMNSEWINNFPEWKNPICEEDAIEQSDRGVRFCVSKDWSEPVKKVEHGDSDPVHVS